MVRKYTRKSVNKEVEPQVGSVAEPVEIKVGAVAQTPVKEGIIVGARGTSRGDTSEKGIIVR